MATTARIFGNKRVGFGQWVIYALIGIAGLFYGTPLAWLFLAGTRSGSSLDSDPPFTFGSFEQMAQSWANLASFNDFQILNWALNSLIYSVGGVTLSLIACIPAGYALATSDFPGRRVILILTLVAMITPSQSIVLPIFLEMNLIGLNNTYLGLILATGFFPFGVYLAYIHFSDSPPKGVLDSARIDGCSRYQLFTHIALPLARPIVSLVAFFSFLANWSNYYLAVVLLSDDKIYNLPVGLTALVSGSGALTNLAATGMPIKKPEVILAAILVILPVLVVFLIAQRFVRSGMLSGAEKG